jgi:hypothetical protein
MSTELKSAELMSGNKVRELISGINVAELMSVINARGIKVRELNRGINVSVSYTLHIPIPPLLISTSPTLAHVKSKFFAYLPGNASH